VALGSMWCGSRLHAPGHGRKKLIERERLGHGDVGQNLHAVRRRGPGREVATADENRQPRRPAPGPNRFQPAIALWFAAQHQVEDDQQRPQLLHVKWRDRVIAGEDLVALAWERLAEHLAQRRVILDDQNPVWCARPCLL
jgi:hypothetical protein